MLRQRLSILTIQTPGRGLIEITLEARSRFSESAIQQGLLKTPASCEQNGRVY